MDFGALPPEVNSARMYAGPGSGPMLAAAAAWDGLAAELRSAASSYGSVVSGLTGESWLGPSSTAMAAAAAPYVAWMNATAAQAEQAATQAKAAAGAYEAAFAMTVPPPVIAANRAQLASLIATNIFGQNTPAIAATEAQYGEMWAQDAAAMYGYAGELGGAASQLTPFTAPPQTTNPAGWPAGRRGRPGRRHVDWRGRAVNAVAAHFGGSHGSTEPRFARGVVNVVDNRAFGHRKCAGSDVFVHDRATSKPFEPAFRRVARFLARRHLDRSGYRLRVSPGVYGHIFGERRDCARYGYCRSPKQWLHRCRRGAAAAPLAGGAAAAAAGGALGSGFAGGAGGLAGLGQAASVGTLSVPQGWGWAATPQAAMMGGVPLASALPGANLGATSGLPLAAGLPMMGGLPRAAGVAAAAGVGGAVASKYAPRLSVLARPPAAGYAPEPASAPAAAYPVPAGFSTNGHAPPGYTPAIVYLPTNGHAPHDK